MNGDGMNGTGGTRTRNEPPASRWPTGRGVDQGGPRLQRYVIRSATALHGLKLELPTDCRGIFVERSPFGEGECILSPARPRAGSGAATVGDLTEGVDVSKCKMIGVEGVDQVFLDSSVAPGVDGEFILVAAVGGAWIHPRVSIELTGDINIPIADPLPVSDAALLAAVEQFQFDGDGSVEVASKPVPSATAAIDVVTIGDTVASLGLALTDRLGGSIQNHGTTRLGLSTDPAATFATCPVKLDELGAWDLLIGGAVWQGQVYAIRDTGNSGAVGVSEFAT